MELFTPGAGNTAAHDRSETGVAGVGTATTHHVKVSDNATNVTADGVSSWNTGTDEQQLRITVTPGHTGMAYARVHVARRQATPDTVWIDPILVIADA